MIQPLHSGNALRLFLEPPKGVVAWRVLRNGTGVFSGPNDSHAALVFEGFDDDAQVLVDVGNALENDARWFYGAYHSTDKVVWHASPVKSAIPNAIYQDQTTDVLSFVRDRLSSGLLEECKRGNFQTDFNFIQVYTAPPVMESALRFPLVTLHLESEESADRGIGETLGPDSFDAQDFEWTESEGWLANVRLQIIGWSLNSDERIELRKAIRRLIVANLPAFDSVGFNTINLSQQDVDSVNGEYPSPIYQVMNTFTCIAPVVVSGNVSAVREVVIKRNEN